ncbi:hypothetical protein ACF3MZ_09060 [Paenibacillaceae bacterium WGS1546]|uniref:hypothetical protein n=1 Tax=Cohnella sp. WGS1546 TaxID=3366810 RepID=UPI00372D0BD6
MNAYEKAIAEQLQLRYGYKPAEAKAVLEEYRAVIGLIGAYPMASDYAEYFHQAKQEGRTGKEWFNAIAKRREEAAAWAQ